MLDSVTNFSKYTHTSVYIAYSQNQYNQNVNAGIKEGSLEPDHSSGRPVTAKQLVGPSQNNSLRRV